MFEITSNQNIRINSGDSASFQVVMDQSTSYYPIPETFIGVRVWVSEKSNSIQQVLIQEKRWYKAQLLPGSYKFTFKDRQWYLNNASVNLLNYGISIPTLSGIHDGDYFIVSYTNGDANKAVPYGSHVDFYLLRLNGNPDDYPIWVKKFYTTGRVEKTWYDDRCREAKTSVTSNLGNVSEEGNFVVTFDPADTEGLDGTYMYLIKATYTDGAKVYSSQIGNKHYFYAINDDYTGRQWNTGTDKLHCCCGGGNSSSIITATDIEAVSYGEQQVLTDKEKDIARDNIDALGENDLEGIIFNGGNATLVGG